MPQRDRYTRNLDLGQRATLTGRRIRTVQSNYSLSANVSGGDSGSLLVADNSRQMIFFNLPPVNAINGQFFEFLNINTSSMHLVGDTNAIVSTYGVAQKAVNYAYQVGSSIRGAGGVVWGDGTKYLLMNRPVATNAVANTYFDG